MTPKRLFSFFATAEAITWTLLISALVARVLTEIPPITVTIVGGTHGAVFLGYGVTAALVGVNQRWPVGRIIIGIALAIVPFATVPFERSILTRSLLDGQWRTAASSDPRDNHWFDRLFRWFITRPVILIVTLVGVVAFIFAVLVSLGTPTEWFN
jgi:integral membrane protein